MYACLMKAKAFIYIVLKHASRQQLVLKLKPNYVNLCFYNFKSEWLCLWKGPIPHVGQ